MRKMAVWEEYCQQIKTLLLTITFVFCLLDADSNNYTGIFLLPDLEIAEYVMKGCSGEGVSNRTAKVYSEDDHEVHNTYYCDSNFCNIRFTGAPASPTQAANGMECYSCFDRGTGDCAEGNATRVKCLGDMNQCMDFTVINGAWKMTYRTCALETLCRRQYMMPELSGRLEISCCSTPLCNDGRPGLKSICSHFSEQEKGQTLLRGCSLEKLCWEKPQLLGLDRNSAINCCSSTLCNRSLTPMGDVALVLLLLLFWLL
ncbi:urokinase plasminogen activator surface receptor-like [Crotalus adamanteus]|uniref:Urokinase plasminogen activator surface receptor-like n=1 Tax=Crotalus adamanteus TaxID=8729 RepID=A0AAW1AXY7_CROAD